MTEYVTKTGRVLTDADIERFADEDERNRAIDMIEWYVQCLRSLHESKAVRGLTEAKAGYDEAMEYFRAK